MTYLFTPAIRMPTSSEHLLSGGAPTISGHWQQRLLMEATYSAYAHPRSGRNNACAYAHGMHTLWGVPTGGCFIYVIKVLKNLPAKYIKYTKYHLVDRYSTSFSLCLRYPRCRRTKFTLLTIFLSLNLSGYCILQSCPACGRQTTTTIR